jgi:hypothetical protein
MLNRREWLRVAVAGVATGVVGRRLFAEPAAGGTLAAPTEITVYKSPSCGCCAKWVEHMQGAGFKVTVKDVDDVAPVKREMGVPASLESCHTGVVGGYVVEGHVPADLVQRVLREKPKLAGLAVPGMVTGSPGMEMGARKDPYDVIAFDRSGKTRVYAKR